MLLIASSPDYRGRRPTAEKMAKIAYCGVASWLQSGTTDVALLIAAMSGRGVGRSDWRCYDAERNTNEFPYRSKASKATEKER